MKSALCLGVLCTAVIVAGCTGDQPAASGSPAAGSADVAVPAAPETVDVRLLSWDDTQKLINGHPGRVVVVDLWSTSCAPCMQEFPNLVRLHEEYGDRVTCISVAIEYLGVEGETPDKHRERVLEFLQKQNAAFHNILLTDPADDIYDRLDLGSIPAVIVVDSQGTAKRFDNDRGEYPGEGFTYEDHVLPYVRGLLN